MKRNTKSVFYMLMVLCPVFGFSIIHSLVTAPTVQAGRQTAAVTLIRSGTSPVRNSMYNALAYYYYNPSSGVSGAIPLSSFSQDTEKKLFDGSLFDSSTGYTTTITASGSCFVYGLIDLGPSPPAVSAFEMTYTTPGGGAVGILVGSNDGTNWSANLTTSGGSATTATKTPITGGTYRYYQCFTATGGAPRSSSTLTDFRLYDNTGLLIGGPIVVNPPSAPGVAPTYTNIGATAVTLNNVPALSAAGSMPSKITVTVAGTVGTRGDYLPATPPNDTYGGTTQYTNGTYWLSNLSGLGVWVLNDGPNNTGTEYYSTNDGYTAPFPTTGWATQSGSAPVPVFALQNAGAATSLNIQKASDSAFTINLTTFASVTPSTNYTDNTLTPSTLYWYRYVEVNSGGSSPGPASSVTTLNARRRMAMWIN